MIVRFLFITLLCFASTLAFSQHNSVRGTFSFPKAESCVGDILISVPACGPTNSCTIAYSGIELHVDDGDPIPFTTPGIIDVVVTIGNDPPDQLQLIIYPGTAPTFDMYACDGYQVSLKITDTTFPSYLLDYNDGTGEVETTTGDQPVHQYPAPNPTQQITLRGDYANCPTTTQTMNVDDPGARNITQLTVTDNNEIILDLEPGAQFENVLYELTNNGSEVIPFQEIHNTNQVTISRINPDLDPDNEYYCFTLNTANPCPGNLPIPGNTLCSSTFSVTPQLSNRMNLAWKTSSSIGGLQNFEIQKNDAPLSTQPSTANQYPDTDVVCPQEYSYRLISNYPAGTSLSKIRTATAISSILPPAINAASTIVNENSVELLWTQPPGFTPVEYEVSKSSVLNVIGTTSTPAFTDNAFDPRTNLCYQIRYDDACGNASGAGIPICSINLKGSLADNNDALLEWTAYTGWGPNGVDHYTIERYNESGELLSSEDVEKNLNHSDPESETTEQIVIYRISAHPDDPLVPSVSNEVKIIRSNRIAYPTAFVPGSSIEDNATFKVIAREEYNDSFELQIYNRWGELIFITTDVNEGWDGTYKGNRMPEGTYVFIARFVDRAGRTLKHSGNVVLLRK